MNRRFAAFKDIDLHILKRICLVTQAEWRSINRHKRKAWVSIEMFGRSVDMEVGLEIVKKV